MLTLSTAARVVQALERNVYALQQAFDRAIVAASHCDAHDAQVRRHIDVAKVLRLQPSTPAPQPEPLTLKAHRRIPTPHRWSSNG